MTAGSWHLTGRAQTLAMALARHCTIPFVPLSVWESPAFKFKPNEKFFPSLFHYLLALVSLRTGAEEPGEPEAESTSTSCGLYLVSRLQHNEFVLRATLNPVPMQNWLHVEKSSAKRETRANFCITNSWEEIHIFWTQQWLKNQNTSRLQGGSDRRVITERKPRKADRFLTPTKEQRNACNAWQTPWQVSVLFPSNAMNPRPWHLPAVIPSQLPSHRAQEHVEVIPGRAVFHVCDLLAKDLTTVGKVVIVQERTHEEQLAGAKRVRIIWTHRPSNEHIIKTGNDGS
ncbi:hypothetical protein B0H13DRAFT_2513996 [Mycena leptocephala]|nr:hypothetical protein B0H13DRAFT_2513996 [Mycena leptocephala]